VDVVRRIADAVLYEGYILWPYRRSAMKNRQRWTFGGVYPETHTRRHRDDPSLMRAEVLLEAGPEAVIDVRLRFLHVVERRVARVHGDALEFVDELLAGGERHLAWDEAVEREVTATGLALDGVGAGARIAIDVPVGQEREAVEEADGRDAGAVVRGWRPLSGTLLVQAARAGDGLWRVSAEVTNTSPWEGGDREDALRQTFVSTHAVLHAPAGAWVSPTDPPEALRPAVDRCVNTGVWPVLVGEPCDRTTILASPIILEDHPQVAAESPGDFFDGGEIDQMLVLNVLALTDEEKAEMRATDPRARQILERTAAMEPEDLMRLNGRLRDLRSVR
jgi:hypothetical protein